MASEDLKLDNITRNFGGLTALLNVTFGLNQGEILGIMGPNGAGKTTLFNVISGFLKPDRGTIWYREKNITGLKPHRIVNLGISRTFQIVRPFRGLNVCENILIAALSPRSRRSFGPGTDPEEISLKALEMVGLLKRRDDQVENLPQGDLRRLEIARALATRPDLILLDEPFSGLSWKEMERIADLVRELNADGCAILIIEHKLKILMNLAHRILVLNFGNIIADGTPREVAENKEVIQAYLGKKERRNVFAGN